jgi:hypothetical protein
MNDLQRDLEAHIGWLYSVIGNQSGQSVPPQFGEVAEYRISDSVRSEFDSEGDESDTTDVTEIRGQQIPAWAISSNLQPLLQSQQTIDPDTIFTDFEKTCDLSAIFENQRRRFEVRGDSGSWTNDGLTTAEELNYKKAVGLA